MKNRLLARLERQIRLHGEPIQLVHVVGTSKQSFVRANVRGIIKPLTVQQLVGNVSQQNFLIVIAPSHLRRAGWPGGVPATIPGGTVPTVDPSLPNTSDNVIFRGATKTITGVAAVYDGDDCVRIELKVLG